MHASKAQIEQVGRLKKRSDFLRVQKTGSKWVAKGMIVQAAPQEGADQAAGDNKAPCRFGLTVTRRLSKSAVVRNRIKRRLRAAACDILPGNARPGTDFVLIGRPETATRLYTDLKKDLKWCLGKLGYLQEME